MTNHSYDTTVAASGYLDRGHSLQRVYQALDISAKLKSVADDFIVKENISIEFSGEGEHCWLYIRKRGCNTDWIAQQLAAYCSVKKMAVSYAGLKDRHAVTSQWFSVQLPGRPTPEWCEFEASFRRLESEERVEVLKCFRHNKKLQRGALKSNTFRITLRELSDNSEATFDSLELRCHQIAKGGVPNYFGAQRFGRNYNNLDQAEKLFARPRYKLAKHKRSLYLSAARSWLFNRILSERVKQGIWNSRLAGDVFMLNGRSACFKDDADNADEIDQRLMNKEINPTAIMWGQGDIMVTSQAADLERAVVDQFPVFRDGLIVARLQAQRRSCRVIPEQLACSRLGDDFVISFTLPTGSYATMVLAEIFFELDESNDNNSARAKTG
ncbi:MAG: tRNA pseudouridine(13) synthase TruD [Gammaproteobacteria bacterium]|nr:tRNA pseudouridine(13) synthase TruD [Gammaproteobacteria bacterium]